MDMITLRDNESAYDRYRICPQVLRDLTSLDTSTTIFGTRIRFPFGFSPTAMQAMAHPDGECATSRATAALNVPMVLSNYSTKPLEDVIAHSSGNPYAMQMSLLKNKGAMINLQRRAQAAGFKAVLVTLDVLWLRRRLNEFRHNFSLPHGMEYPNLLPGIDATNLEDGDDSMAYGKRIQFPPPSPFDNTSVLPDMQLTFVLWRSGAKEFSLVSTLIKNQSTDNSIVSGIKDAKRAIACGFDGILISNHGGRQLDSVPASLDILREVALITRGLITVAIDGGIRRGTDIFKAFALGADFCFAGRPAIWDLAYDGQKGVELGLNLLYDEFTTAMALAGCRNVSEITSESISVLQPDGVLAKL
ncbi:FMN-dependent dehydrogenase [Penicillium longicatenatum]|nr:FMN-dependent dehydrogenase [Penicillium longicatenatum]